MKLVTHEVTGEQRAMKIIKMKNVRDLPKLDSEIQVCRKKNIHLWK